MTKRSDPQDLLRRVIGNTTPMQSDERVMQAPQRRSMSGVSFQILQEFARKAQEEGLKQARSSNVPIPQMGKPTTRSPETTSDD